MWSFINNLFHLFKKWTRGVIIFRIFCPVPTVTPPTWLAVYCKLLLRRIHRESFLSAFVTVAPEDVPGIVERHSPFQSAFWTPCGRRNFYFFIKIKIFRFYCEILFAVLALFVFSLHF